MSTIGRRGRLRDSEGITFVEVILVMVLVGILTAMAVPGFSRILARMDVATAADGISNKLLTSRARALAEVNVHCGVHFDVAGEWCRAFLDHDGQNSFSTGDEWYLEPFVLPETVDFVLDSSDVLTNATTAVVFRGDGSAKSGQGTKVVVKHGRYDGLRKEIDILPSTGRVRGEWK